MPQYDISDKVRAFLVTLTAVCKGHGIRLKVYDHPHLQLWDLEGEDAPFDERDIEDCTTDACGRYRHIWEMDAKRGRLK